MQRAASQIGAQAIMASSRSLRLAGSTPAPALIQGRFKSVSAGGSKGQVAQKNPSKFHMDAGKTYNWCACGLSSKQPLCDGSHKNSPNGMKPIQFKSTETKDVMFCNCKQTDKGPFCDGSHKKL